MRATSTILFAGAAAAATSKSQAGYATITPGGTYAPITVTQQYQTIPTYVSDASSSSLSSYLYVSTVITDGDNNKCTVTKTEQPVTVSHHKSTITHTTTYNSAMPTGMYPYNKNGTAYPTQHTKTWEELYEKIDEVPYKEIGPSALPNFPGSGLCGKCQGSKENQDEDVKYQPVHVKEYTNGKWQTYDATYTYGAPTPKASTYDQTGTYTVPAYDMTVHKTTTVAAEGKFTAPAGKTVTYGGSSIEVSKPTHITAAYAECETKGAETKTIIKTTTITANKPGTYTIAKPTVTAYPSETVCSYPSAVVYPPGVYHHTKETVTITKTKQVYTCYYHSSTTSTPSSSPTPTLTPSATDVHPSGTPTDTPTPSGPPTPDPSADYPEPEESYGYPTAYPTAGGYVKRGGMLQRRSADEKKAAAPLGKRVILV